MYIGYSFKHFNKIKLYTPVFKEGEIQIQNKVKKTSYSRAAGAKRFLVLRDFCDIQYSY